MNSAPTILSKSQIEAASRLHAQLRQWHVADRCLEAIARHFPNFDIDSCFVKTTVLDRLYGTKLRNLATTAEHLHRTLHENGPQEYDVRLIQKLSVMHVNGDKIINQASFASKFGHFFRDCELPIMDKYSQRMVAYHLGRAQSTAENNRSYEVFHARWNELRERDSIKQSCREIDRYLWIAGQFHTHRKLGQKAPLNKELRRLFHLPTAQPDLELLIRSPRLA